MKRLTRVSLLLSGLVLLLSAVPSFAEKRGVTVEGNAAKAYIAEQYGTSWAVVIGINDYQHSRVPKLQYAVNDAVAIERALLARGFKQEHIIKLLDREATKSRIERVLGDELRQNVGRNDRVLVFFAGHGKTDRLRSNEEEGYLIPVDGDPSQLFSTAVSMTALRQISDRLLAKHILYVVDSCYSGYALFNRGIGEDLLEEMVKKPAIQILTAGRQQDQAQERNGHGVFTEVLLRGLEGDAFAGKSWLSLEELGVWMKQRVYVESNKKQLPQFGNLSGEGQFVFVKGGVEAAKLERPSASTGLSMSAGGLAPASDGGDGRVPVPNGPSAALTQAEQELAALKEQERQMEESERQAELQRQVEEKKQQLAEKKKKLEVASLPSYSAPKQIEREIIGKDGAPMVLVPEGVFWYLGSTSLSKTAFYMDKYEVSTAQYAKYMAAAGAKEPRYWPTSVLVSNGQKPVVGVSWHEATAYCRHYGKRLPHETEWVRAAGRTSSLEYPWGDEKPNSTLANYDLLGCGFFCDVYTEKLKPVGTYEAGKSPYGIYDMAGNVWEWGVAFADSSSSKVIRGGSWYTNNVIKLRIGSDSNWRSPDDRDNDIGFRCVQDAR